ncbi:MAG: DNA gyrase/topoisomerase IV subunit A [Salibacteraceae bacterium]
MSEAPEDNQDERDEEFGQGEEILDADRIVPISGMYENWFLDYASYVILERAVPHVNDGLKPVQRRILHSLKELDDGRYNKVANVVGNTMKYHPHGDASIADALVALGQKELLIDMQGNWGNIYTGDRAAAPRYIEARLSKFALEVVFNPKTTEWLASYDGRNKEPVTLPVKFPLLLTQGVEGIAVGLSTKMLPHNFIELIDASIKLLQGKRTKIYPDFLTGGMADFSNYNDGKRGGKVRVRAKISSLNKKTLIISELPYNVTTSSLIDSVLKANDKGKIKIKKIEDNTAEFVEILVYLAPGVSPDKTIDALYAFTDCEISISPNAVIIENDKPRFVGVSEILEVATDNTKNLLQRELEIRKSELTEQWHFASLEKIFIENKIYIEFDGKTYEEAIEVTLKLLKPHTKHLKRAVTEEDVKRLLEIRMRRITKHDADKADNFISSLEDELAQVQFNLDHLVDYAIDYYKNLKKKYSEGKERKTEIKNFEEINKAKVAVANVKLYVNRTEGFIGTGLRKSDSEFVCDCSDIDDIIVIRKDGVLVVSKISDKAFVGKDILHVNVWKKGDERTIYNLIYLDAKKKYSMVKRFAVTSITRDKEYHLTTGEKGSKILYMTANPNGEAEVIKVLLRPIPKLKRLKFDFDFSEIAIKGRGAKGNILSKTPVHKIELKEKGVSTLGGRNIWWDDTVQRLNTDERGRLLGEFHAEDKIVSLMASGHYKLSAQTVNTHFDDDMIVIEKYDSERVYTMVYYDGEKANVFVKRFVLEPTDKKTLLMSEHEDSKLMMITSEKYARARIEYDRRSSSTADEEMELFDFIAVKGQKSLGNKLSNQKIKNVVEVEPTQKDEVEETKEKTAEIVDPTNVETTETTAEPQKNKKSDDVVEEKPKIQKEVKKEVVVPKVKEKPLEQPKEKKKEVLKEIKKKIATPKVEEKKVVSKVKEEPKTEPENKETKKGGEDDDLPPEGPVQITLDL